MNKRVPLVLLATFVALSGRLVAQAPAVARESSPSAAVQPPPAVAEGVLVPTAAVLPFEARGRQAAMEETGKTVAELLFVSLLEGGAVDLVERADLNKALDELHISAVGLASPESQLKLGQLVGAKLLITGSVFEAAGKKYVVAKLIGTETSRVVGCSVSGHGDYAELVPELAAKVQATLERDTAKLLPRKTTLFSAADRLAEVRGASRKVFLQIKEDLHQASADPAALTALRKLLLTLDFVPTETRGEADYIIVCDALATAAGQYHKFSSAEARVELSVYEARGNKLLAAGVRKETLAGASYLTAAKEAVTQATLKLATDTFNCLK